MSEKSDTRSTSGKALREWLAARELWGHPFRSRDADNDAALPMYFVTVEPFDQLVEEGCPAIVFAGRGCGKSAYRRMLASECRPTRRDAPRLAVLYGYDAFDRLRARSKGNLSALTARDHVAVLLGLAADALEEAAAAQELPEAPRAAMTASLDELLVVVRSESALEQLGEEKAMRRLVNIARKIGVERIQVLVDQVDESPLTAGQPEQACDLLAELLGCLSLLKLEGWAFRFFLPADLEPYLREQDWYRPDIETLHIAWTPERLIEILNERLVYYSNNKFQSLEQLYAPAEGETISDRLARSAQGSPRAVLVLADMLLRAHAAADPLAVLLLTNADWAQVEKKWVQQRSDFTLGEAALLQLDIEHNLVWLGGQEIRAALSSQEYSALLALYRHAPGLCTKDDLSREVWPESCDAGVSDEAIQRTISRLREALEEQFPGKGSRFIETIRSRGRGEGGYRLWPNGDAPE